MSLTRRQKEIYEFLVNHAAEFPHPPTLEELCSSLGLSSRGSMHKQVQALVAEGLVEPMHRRQRGIRLTDQAYQDHAGLPLLGTIAAGCPIEAVTQQTRVAVPDLLRTKRPCYVLRVKGESMVDVGILDGDLVVIEQRTQARNGEIVVALIHGGEATLKRIEQRPDQILLHSENPDIAPLCYAPDEVDIQGVLVGQMRSYA